MTTKKESTQMVRMNSRVRPNQKKYVRDLAKKRKVTEGEVTRDVIDYYITNHKNNV